MSQPEDQRWSGAARRHAAAITATAHKLARIYYHLVTTKQADDESSFQREDEAHQKRRLERVKREAVALGFTLTEAVPST